MDASETHYLTYDPDEIMTEMQYAYIEAGGDVIYPGDEKDMLLRAVQSVLVQAFAGVDTALRMATLRYAVGDYLDLYGEKRGCTRIQAAKAGAEIEVIFRASGTAKVIPAGTAVTADGAVMYLTDEEIVQTGEEQTARVRVTAQQAGSAGNALTAGRQMQFVSPQYAVTDVRCTADASGGQEAEDDESYRERIRKYGLASVTTGPSAAYESAAMNVSGEIIDARAINLGAGRVGVALLADDGADMQALAARVEAALSDRSVRPLTDEVQVFEAEAVDYAVEVQCSAEGGLDAELKRVAQSWRTWQDGKIGRAFNPDRLMAELYQAGASRVIWEDASTFNGGALAYTEIGATQRCRGTVSLTVKRREDTDG
ncbi:MAG: baseplate J/gp47 family protein [Clostridiales bacterium]|nr:baseplate J/gp47 family protein [Clostridiales bacterium]